MKKELEEKNGNGNLTINHLANKCIGILSKLVVKWWGERCPDFDPDCCVCQAWQEYDKQREEILNGL